MAHALLKDEKGWCTTEIRATSISFTWTIKNFCFVITEVKDDDMLRSPYFSSNIAFSDIKWCLAIERPYNWDYYEDGSLDLRLCSTTKNPVFAKYTLCILDNKNKKHVLVARKTPTKFDKSVCEACHSTIEFKRLFDDAENLLVDDTLKLQCEITFTDNMGINSDSGPGQVVSGKLSNHHVKLSRDLEDLLKNQLMSDVKLVTNGETFNAHKAILTARSPVFAAMFSHEELLEGKNGEVKIQDVDEDILREILHFIYTGKTENVKNMARDVLPVADKYDLRELKEECEFYLANTLSIENAAELLTFANFHNATLLKENFLNFFKRNSDAVMETTGWNTLVRNNSDLLNVVKVALPQLTVK